MAQKKRFRFRAEAGRKKRVKRKKVKRKVGRPRRTKKLARPTTFTVDPDLVAKLDKYAVKRQKIEKRPFSRSEALCELLRMALMTLLIFCFAGAANGQDFDYYSRNPGAAKVVEYERAQEELQATKRRIAKEQAEAERRSQELAAQQQEQRAELRKLEASRRAEQAALEQARLDAEAEQAYEDAVRGWTTVGVVLLLLYIATYLLPTFVAFGRKHPSRAAIFILNILAGWTGIGWLVCLVWAFTSTQGNGVQQSVVVNVHGSQQEPQQQVGKTPPPAPAAANVQPMPSLPKTRVSKEEAREVRGLYFDYGMSAPDVAARTNIHPKLVEKIINIDPRKALS